MLFFVAYCLNILIIELEHQIVLNKNVVLNLACKTYRRYRNERWKDLVCIWLYSCLDFFIITHYWLFHQCTFRAQYSMRTFNPFSITKCQIGVQPYTNAHVNQCVFILGSECTRKDQTISCHRFECTTLCVYYGKIMCR